MFKIPIFKEKSKKNGKSSDTLPVSTVDEILKQWEIKEMEKKEKQEQILKNNEEKEKNTILKEKEQNIMKSFQETKKLLLKEKKDINKKLKDLKPIIKKETNKENKADLQKSINDWNARISEIDKILLEQSIQVLQAKKKIKEEK